ncbi:MAG: alpha/beta fold hydrolase [Abditibacteriales bacterium]|nr:alpha/beta fold hydrolase [Abditibacteriales bacterium]MDW8367357.1 alpha/beta fold hydrolase [Abditibacteriales bacterium]
MEQPITFASHGCRLFGILHLPDGGTVARAVVFLHGWSGYRTGPHQMFVRAARRLEREGMAALRFDFRGRGDSEGVMEHATLATMVEDTHAAVAWLVEQTGVGHVTLLGICSGSEVAFGAATLHPAIDSLALWSAPIFAAEASVEREIKKKAFYLKEYGRKLFRAATWRKLFTGALQPRSIARVLLGRSGGENIEGAQPGQLPQGFRRQTLERFKQFRGDVLLIYGTNDPVTNEALAWYIARCREISIEPTIHLVTGANHSYYALAWEREVIERTATWLTNSKTLAR